MNRVAIKKAAIRRGDCKAEFVDQLCAYCETRGACKFVPPRTPLAAGNELASRCRAQGGNTNKE